jgi:hypothetical protein
MIHLLTSRPASTACRALLRDAAALGIRMRATSGASFAREDVVFAYGAFRSQIARARSTPARQVNCVRFGKHEQYERMASAGIPVPRWALVAAGAPILPVLDTVGFPCVLKPNEGGFGRGVRIVADPAELEAAHLRRPHVVQRFVPCGGRCARVLVVGGRVVTVVNRVAKDGKVATYAGGAKGWLERITLHEAEIALASEACRVLGIEVGGVDLIRSAEGPFILEVNHHQVPFFIRNMYGEAAGEVVRHLNCLHASLRTNGPSEAVTAPSSVRSTRRRWVRRDWNGGQRPQVERRLG